jgi:hypothetical protein
MRGLDRIAVGKSKQDGISECFLGPAYNHETQVEIKFSDLIDICEYSNRHSIMRVGRQIRQYIMGTPMGEQGSCAKANGVCLDDELRIDKEREEKHHDSERNLSLAYVDDKHAIVAYDENDQLWTRASAEKYLSELMTYSDPLRMVVEPQREFEDFLETTVQYPLDNGTGVILRHKDRPWETDSYRIALGGVAGTADIQAATATGTFMRIIDNSTFGLDAAISIATDMNEMCNGAGMGRGRALQALQRLSNNREDPQREATMKNFLIYHETIIRMLFDGFWAK